MDSAAALFEMAPVGMGVLDADGRILAWNARAEAVFAVARSEALGRRFGDLLSLSERVTWAGLLSRARAFGAPERRRFRPEPRERAAQVVEVTAGRLDPDTPAFRKELGGLPGLVLAFDDVSEHALVEQERAEALQQTLTALAVRDEFLSVASHELRTPLTSLRLVVQSLERDLMEEALTEAGRSALVRKVQAADRQVVRLQRLVEGLLDVASIQSGRLRLERSVVDLAAVVEGAVEELDDQFARAGCAPKLDLERPVKGPWDERRLRQVVLSLLANALRYAPGTVIEVNLRLAGGRAVLEVSDHGIGIDPDDLARIFARFERASPSRNYGGLGLGLFISRKIVEAHGGTIQASSRPGEGATFRVELPIHLQDA
ncbi:MAG: HAMP domain-containing histidine kinase [Myxococcaceae bacterium]|nr:HAMP domain-containing histidine kinase [Myxococcaceae bacterium]